MKQAGAIVAKEATTALARFASGLDYRDIPERVCGNVKNLLLDALACAIAGHAGEETPQVTAFASTLAQSRESGIIGADRLSLTGATVLNAYLITAVTMCDVHRATLTHVTPEVVPPALAIAERDGCSGRDLLVALAAGLETTTRIGIGLNYDAFRARGWHGPGVLGPFGAAAAVGRLLGFDAECMARAFGLAGSQAAGTFAAWGTPTVKFHQCRGALSGLMAALLAQQKFVAPRTFLTADDGGLYNTYSDGGRPEEAIKELGSRWELENLSVRLWPSAVSIQSVITAMFDLVEQHAPSFDQIRRVRVAVGKTAFEMHGGFARYRGKFEALLSAHYVVAVILRDRALTLAQFEPSRYDDPELKKFAAERVEVVADSTLAGAQAVVEAETLTGAKVTVRCDFPKGSPENPATQAQVENKFRTYAKARLNSAAIESVLSAVKALEELPSAGDLMRMLRVE
jgi:2-methylcitrate dehydratase PrpD